jgi:6-phosphogluconolactonase
VRIEVLADSDAAARRAAQFIAIEARAAVAARGRFALAVSGGRTPWQMLRVLATLELPWSSVHLFQVDERVAPPGDADRNLTHVAESLLASVAVSPLHVHAMPVEEANLAAAAARYARELATVAGTPPVLDVVHLGLGPDGHTASLVPNDPVLHVADCDVALTDVYLGHRRMTLTYPMLNRARRVLWLVTGADKIGVLARLHAGDRTIPAGGVESGRALIIADAAAAGAHAQQQ